MSFLLVGLGNPGSAYEGTRHNVGFAVIRALAEKLGANFRPALSEAKGSLAQIKRGEETLFLLMPLTYMNESGLAVRRCLDYYKIPVSNCLIVVDDADLPFGALRLREKGSSGGHNGLKSVAAHLASEVYTRLRIGVGRSEEEALADYVLARFTSEEEKELPKVIENALKEIDAWLTKVKMGEQNG